MNNLQRRMRRVQKMTNKQFEQAGKIITKLCQEDNSNQYAELMMDVIEKMGHAREVMNDHYEDEIGEAGL